ncbi:phosphatase PAP2 family protein [Nonomuraea sp. NPDC049421]|uniref:phosphatase PAP2 family protein n=1 Tax=Nonomuraea sp. NPDC049421 TaxID=3155275 RepID=UPI00342971D9
MEIRPVEGLLLGYFALMATVVVLAHERVPGAPGLLGGCLLGGAFLVLAARAGQWRPGDRRVAGLRFMAPLLVMPVVYSIAAEAALAVHGRFLDDAVRAWERGVFGVDPNAVVAEWAMPPTTELVTFCYFSFYGCFLIAPVLYFRGRANLAEGYLFALLATLIICYVGFMALPLEGPAPAPPELYAAQRPSGYLITPLQNAIMAALDPPGACFPSPHVAGAWITVLTLRRHVRGPASPLLWLAAVGLTVAVVHNSYHYVSDLVAGLMVALVVHAVISRTQSARRTLVRTG